MILEEMNLLGENINTTEELERLRLLKEKKKLLKHKK